MTEAKFDYIVDQKWAGEEGAETKLRGAPVLIFSTIEKALAAAGAGRSISIGRK